jgi:hypothetical protein
MTRADAYLVSMSILENLINLGKNLHLAVTFTMVTVFTN